MKTLFVIALLTAAAAESPIDVGVVDQKRPAKGEVKPPKPSDKTPAVELQGEVKGTAKGGEKRPLYVLVAPVGGADGPKTWWVQGETSRDKDGFTATAQYGEESAGAGEFFAVLAVAADAKWMPGEQLTELPADALYSKVKYVKRAK